jgi:YVTN family beta-propeller protein
MMKLPMLLLAAGAMLGASCGEAETPITGQRVRSTGTLLVGNKGENSVSFIELGSGTELGRAATGRMPHEIAISPDGRQAAVVAYGGQTIDIFDVARRERLRTIDLAPNQGPHGIAWLEDGHILATTERSQALTIVDTRSGDQVSAIATGQQGTHMVAVSPDRSRAFTANIASGTVSVLDLRSRTKLRDIAVGGQPEGIALSRDGGTLWVGDLEGARVQAFDTASFGARRGEHRRGADPGRGEPRRTLDRHLEPGQRQPHHHRRAHARGRARDQCQRQPRGGAGDHPLLRGRAADLCRRDRTQPGRRGGFRQRARASAAGRRGAGGRPGDRALS